MTCRAQHLGHYLEGQGHSMTLQQNRVRPITLLFEVEFLNYLKEMTYLEGQGHSMTLHHNGVWPITLLFEDRF